MEKGRLRSVCGRFAQGLNAPGSLPHLLACCRLLPSAAAPAPGIYPSTGKVGEAGSGDGEGATINLPLPGDSGEAAAAAVAAPQGDCRQPGCCCCSRSCRGRAAAAAQDSVPSLVCLRRGSMEPRACVWGLGDATKLTGTGIFICMLVPSPLALQTAQGTRLF